MPQHGEDTCSHQVYRKGNDMSMNITLYYQHNGLAKRLDSSTVSPRQLLQVMRRIAPEAIVKRITVNNVSVHLGTLGVERYMGV